MDSFVSPKNEVWILRVCHHISNAVYQKPEPDAKRSPLVAAEVKKGWSFTSE
jgi:hypothetical protein